MRHVTSLRKGYRLQRHTVDADWSMQDGRYDQSPDPDVEDNEGFPHGPRREMRPGNSTKLLTTNISFNRAQWFVCKGWLTCMSTRLLCFVPEAV